MARTRKGTPPTYPKHPHISGQARITVRLTSGKRHDITLGDFGSPESRAEYQRVLVLLEANGGCYPVRDDGTAASGLTVAELALQFWRYAKSHYRLADGSSSRELDHFEYALQPVIGLYGHALAREFGPLALKAVHQRLIDARQYLVSFEDEEKRWETWLPEVLVRTEERMAEWRKKWRPAEIVKSRATLSRKVINQRIDHIKRVFGWAVSEELVPASVHDALLRVAGLRRGHAGTRDKPKVKPVPDEHVTATLPNLAP